MSRVHPLAALAFAVFVAALLLPNLYANFVPRDATLLERAEPALLAGSFWLLWFALFRRLWVGVVAASLLCVWLWPLEMYLRTKMGAPLTGTSIAFAAETHPGELMEFLRTGGASAALPFALFAGVAGVTVFATRRARLAWTHRSRRWVLVAGPLLFVASHLAFEQQYSGLGLKAMSDPFRPEPLSYWGLKWQGVFPVDLPFAFAEYLEDRNRVDRLRREVEEYSFGAQQGGTGADVIVVVIGESSRRDRWSLGGYDRKTNPLLERQAGLVFFDNVVSRSVATRTAVPSILSRQPVLMPDGTPNGAVEPSFLRALREVGYATHWFSNQGGTGFFDTSSIFHAKDAQDMRMLNPTSFRTLGAYDETLLGPLAEALAGAGKVVAVLHTMGSHFDFRHRYPGSFDRFQPSLQSAGLGQDYSAGDMLAIGNGYDNTILYTDRVLSQVIEQVRSTGRRGAVVFVADHGVDLPDPVCRQTDVESRSSAQAYRVPAFVWLSDAMQAGRPELLGRLRELRSAPQVNDFVFPTVLELSGTTVRPGVRPSVAVGLLDTERPVSRRVVGYGAQWVDFDAAEARDGCRIRAP